MKKILIIIGTIILILSSTGANTASIHQNYADKQEILLYENDNDFISIDSSDWTIMIYLDGDNNVEGMNIDLQFSEFADVGSTEDVNIVVQFDRIPGYSTQYGDWTTTKRYLVEKNMCPSSENALEDLGELNMGDPQTVVDFATWAMNNYPAEKYCLVFCGHGYGWKGGICPDITDNDVLDILEIKTALSEVTNNGANPIDLIGFDGCKMQMIEIGYELTKYAKYITASEAPEIWGGWKYDPALSELVNNPSISPERLGELFVEAFMDAGGKTLSTIDLGLLKDLISDLSNFASILQNDGFRQDIKDSILEVENYYENEYSFSRNYVDLYHFVQLLSNKIDDNEIESYAQQVIYSIENAMFSSDHNYDYQNSNGVSIYVPYSRYDQSYNELLFSKESLWDEFLRWYYCANPPDKPVIEGPTNGKTGTEYTYLVSTNDLDNDQVYYLFDWGDGNDSGWLGPYTSGESITESHIWSKQGTYIVKTKAKDVNNAESEWSKLEVSMPKTKSINEFNPWILRLIQRFPILENLI